MVALKSVACSWTWEHVSIYPHMHTDSGSLLCHIYHNFLSVLSQECLPSPAPNVNKEIAAGTKVLGARES